MTELDQYDAKVVSGAFDSVAARYGEVDFLRRTARALVDGLAVRSGGTALDVATGPGTAALYLAERSPRLRVIGIDASAEMIATARSRATQARMDRAEFMEGSATALPFEAGSFDVLLCSSAIYYMPDFADAIREWTRVLRPGGTLAFSSFGAGMLEPMSRLFDARVRAHGVVVPQPTPLYRLTEPDACRALLAGLEDVRIEQRQLGYWLPDARAWWSTLMSTGFCLLVSALDADAREAFEHAHLREVGEGVSDRGLWLDVPALLAYARKP